MLRGIVLAVIATSVFFAARASKSGTVFLDDARGVVRITNENKPDMFKFLNYAEHAILLRFTSMKLKFKSTRGKWWCSARIEIHGLTFCDIDPNSCFFIRPNNDSCDIGLFETENCTRTWIIEDTENVIVRLFINGGYFGRSKSAEFEYKILPCLRATEPMTTSTDASTSTAIAISSEIPTTDHEDFSTKSARSSMSQHCENITGMVALGSVSGFFLITSIAMLISNIHLRSALRRVKDEQNGAAVQYHQHTSPTKDDQLSTDKIEVANMIYSM